MKTNEKVIFWINNDIDLDNGGIIENRLKAVKDTGFDAVAFTRTTGKLVDAGHSLGLKVYADFHCFEGERLWNKYPEARPVDPEGVPIPNEDWYHGVNPAVEHIRQMLLESFEQLVRTYDVDGVWLDFIRWPCHWEVYEPKLVQTSFDDYTLRKFLNDTGLNINDGNPIDQVLGPYFDSWVRWKASVITSWVKAAWEIRNRFAPGVVLGLFGVPWLKDEYDGAITSIIGQDYFSLSQYIDIFSPMTYHLMCNRPVTWIADSVNEIKAITDKVVVPVIQCTDMPKVLEADEYAAAVRTVLKNENAAGIMVFELERLLTGNKLELTKLLLA